MEVLNDEIMNRKKNVDQAIKNGQALLKQTTGKLRKNARLLLLALILQTPSHDSWVLMTTVSLLKKMVLING